MSSVKWRYTRYLDIIIVCHSLMVVSGANGEIGHISDSIAR